MSFVTEIRQTQTHLPYSWVQSPFVTLFIQRTGSTYLMSMLEKHPQVLCEQETFWLTHQQGMERLQQFSTYEDTQRTLRSIYIRRDTDTVKAAGFKFKYPKQMLMYVDVWTWLLRHKDCMRIIHIDRVNALKQALSHLSIEDMHRQTDKPFHTPRTEAWNVDIERLVSLAKYHEYAREQLQVCVHRFHHVHTVSYENLLNDRVGEMRRVQEFLELDVVDVTTAMPKLLPDSLAQIIANYDELCDAVRGTGLERYLD